MEDRQSLLFISYIDTSKEGRCLRAIEALKEFYNVIVCDIGPVSVNTDQRVCIQDTKNKLKNYIIFLIAVKRILKKRNIKIVYGANYYASIPIFLFSKSKKHKIIYDAFELFYPGSMETFSIRDYIFYLFEKKIIKNADAVIATNSNRAAIMLGKYNLQKFPYVIENYSGTPKLLQKPKEKGDVLRLVYAGNISTDRGLNEMISAVVEHSDKYEFDIWGKGPYCDSLQRSIQYFSNVRYRGPYSNENLAAILANYDVGYLYYPHIGWNNIFCSPNKVYDYIYAGLPIVCNENPGLVKLVSSNTIGVCSDTIEKAVKKVSKFYNIYSQNVFDLSKFSYTDKIREIYRRIYIEL